MKVSVIFGTRPEAIKLAPVILALKRDPFFQCRVCVTGQHREMLDQVLQVFGIRPNADLNLMRPNQSLASFTARALGALDHYLAAEKPGLVVVQGDTTTVLCASLAAFYEKIPVAHVEAGLRTGNLQSPWPEEANRVLATRLATLHFAPTPSNRKNLLREGIPGERIFVTGNTVVDSLLFALDRIRSSPPQIPGLPGFLQPALLGGDAGGLTKRTLRVVSKPRTVLITGHRRENFGQALKNICMAIAELARAFPETHFVYPVHLNPNVRQPVLRILGDASSQRASKNIHLIEPVSYLPFVALMNAATVILTDSGGIQEEAPGLGKPVLILRETTERPEVVEVGCARLVGSLRGRIVSEVRKILSGASSREFNCQKRSPFGTGGSADRICAILRHWFCR